MLDKSTYFFSDSQILLSLSQFCFPKIPFLHTVIKVQAQIRESNEQGCTATQQSIPGSPPKMTAAEL